MSYCSVDNLRTSQGTEEKREQYHCELKKFFFLKALVFYCRLCQTKLHSGHKIHLNLFPKEVQHSCRG